MAGKHNYYWNHNANGKEAHQPAFDQQHQQWVAAEFMAQEQCSHKFDKENHHI